MVVFPVMFTIPIMGISPANLEMNWKNNLQLKQSFIIKTVMKKMTLPKKLVNDKQSTIFAQL